ncbi:uncharacterized protein [Littorina saxatilis]
MGTFVCGDPPETAEEEPQKKRKPTKSSKVMKREIISNVTTSKEHPVLPGDTNLRSSCTPGKSGGTFRLPFGAKVVVPEGACTKREFITCKVAAPGQRWQHHPSFPGEHLTSEIFTLTGNIKLQQSKSVPPERRRSVRRQSSPSFIRKRTILLILPYSPPTDKFLELNVKGIWKDEVTWTDVGFMLKDAAPTPCVELELDRLGTFVVTFKHKTDPYVMTPNGGLYHSRLNRNLTIRFPKKAVDTPITFDMKIISIPEDRLTFSREYFAKDCGDLLMVTEFIDLAPDVECDFRRFATIKLPLPAGVEVEGDTADDIVVLHKVPGGSWEWVESRYKFTRQSVTFDVKNPSKFCVVKSKPDRHKKMQDAVRVLEQRMGKEKGEICLFVSIKPKSWMAVLEVYPEDQSEEKINTRRQQGFEVVTKWELPLTESQIAREAHFRRLPPGARDYHPKKMDGFELCDGLTWKVNLTDDLQFDPDSDLMDNSELQCFRYLKESYRTFFFEPVAFNGAYDERKLRGTLVLNPEGVGDDPQTKEQLTMTFYIDIPEEAVIEYLFVPEPEPEPEPVKPKPTYDLPSLITSTEPKSVARPKPALERQRTFSATAMERLTQPSRAKMHNMPEKEAKVLTGKSLMTLAKVVNEGLTLAVHLDLPESTITGIGFDALSNGRSMSDVCYKILLYWKRTRKDKRDGAVQHLLDALRNMGKHGVADVIEERHRENRELTFDCFMSAAVAGVDLSSAEAGMDVSSCV